MNFFEIVNEDLFKPLTWSDKRRYMDILSLLWDECRRKPMYAVSKTEMIDTVESYLIGYNEEITIEEDADLDEEDLVFREALETDPEEDLDLCFLETLFPPLTLTFLVGLVF